MKDGMREEDLKLNEVEQNLKLNEVEQTLKLNEVEQTLADRDDLLYVTTQAFLPLPLSFRMRHVGGVHRCIKK